MTGPADRDPVLMAVADGRSARLRHEIAGLETPAMRGDCLAVMLASDFEAWADEDEETDDSGTWKQSAVDATDGVLDTITGLCRDAIYAALLSERRRAEEAMRERAAAYHDAEAAATQEACDLAWAEYTPDLGLHALGVHKASAAAIRALPLTPEPTHER